MGYWSCLPFANEAWLAGKFSEHGFSMAMCTGGYDFRLLLHGIRDRCCTCFPCTIFYEHAKKSEYPLKSVWKAYIATSKKDRKFFLPLSRILPTFFEVTILVGFNYQSLGTESFSQLSFDANPQTWEAWPPFCALPWPKASWRKKTSRGELGCDMATCLTVEH